MVENLKFEVLVGFSLGAPQISTWYIIGVCRKFWDGVDIWLSLDLGVS